MEICQYTPPGNKRTEVYTIKVSSYINKYSVEEAIN